jgi:ribosomal protein L11 methyltransferase
VNAPYYELAISAIAERDAHNIAAIFELPFVEESGVFLFAFGGKDLAIEDAILTIAPEAKFNWTLKDNESWIENYQKSFEPLEIGGFYIRAAWHIARNDLTEIVIDPELVFGSGHHETTANCLRAIGALSREGFLRGKNVLDLGCGSGILGIAAAKAGAIATMCDTDLKAVEAARENSAKNGVGAAIKAIYHGSIADRAENYDAIFANLVADIILAIAVKLKNALNSGGYLILSGIMPRYKARIYEAFGDLVLFAETENEWLTIVYRRN